MDEGLITPTASRFDLMTGLPNSPNNGNGFPLPQQQQQNTSLFEDPSPFRGGGGGFTVNAVSPTSAFPAQQSLQQQQQYLQLQAQQQFELQRQLAQLGGVVGGGGNGVGGFAAQMGASNGSNATELIAEQMAIQQQLASLKLQQESLMARFGDMQANLVQVTQQQETSPRIGSTGSQNQHRRIPSNQGSGAMGQFGQGGQFGQPIQPQVQTQQGGKQAHARRISVPTTAGPPSQSQSPPIGSNSRGGFAGSTGGFTFGSSGGGQNQNQNQNQQQGGFTFPPNNRSQQQQRNDEVEYGGWGENSPGQGRGGGHHRKQSGSVSSLGGWTWTPSALSLSPVSLSYTRTHPCRRFRLDQSNTANLAEAQNHLQQLATYRASAGHSRVPSFGMSQIGPGGQGGPGQLAMAGYGGGIPQPGVHQGGGGNNNQMRKSLFAPYLPQASIPPLLAAGKLVIGTLRVNKRNRSDAYVATDVLDSDIYICGMSLFLPQSLLETRLT